MPINFPTLDQTNDRMKTDVQNVLDEANPFLRVAYIAALITSYAGRIDAFYITLQELIKQMFPDTATGEYARRWGSYVNINPNTATQATGNATITGVADTVIPINTSFQISGLFYNTTGSVSLQPTSLGIVTLTRIGNTATATTAQPHLLASSMQVTISGANQTEYNGLFQITVITETQFQFQISGAPVTPATGTIVLSFTGATISVESDGFGSGYNQTAGAELNIVTPIAGANSVAYVQFTAIGGGFDNESEQAYKDRYLFRYANPITPFNKAEIVNISKQVNGVTRVFVLEITPGPGQVTIYFTRDNDADPIPNGQEIANVKNKILTIKPAHTEDADVIVLAPTPIIVNFSFAAISPNSESMREAITANLKELFANDTDIGVDVKSYAYLSAIYNTVDPETGNKVLSFSLTSPTGDITVSTGQLAILGTVTF